MRFWLITFNVTLGIDRSSLHNDFFQFVRSLFEMYKQFFSWIFFLFAQVQHRLKLCGILFLKKNFVCFRLPTDPIKTFASEIYIMDFK